MIKLYIFDGIHESTYLRISVSPRSAKLRDITLKHVIIKLLKARDRILKAARTKCLIIERDPLKDSELSFLLETMEASSGI